MKIINKTRKTLLADRVELATGFWRKTLGLMFRSRIADSGGFLMEFGNEGLQGIWMLGMRFGLDLVFIDQEKKVIDIFKDLRPVSLNPMTWKVYYPSKPAKWVLELKSGRTRKKKTAAGDKLSFR